jgi:hypothetical protein
LSFSLKAFIKCRGTVRHTDQLVTARQEQIRDSRVTLLCIAQEALFNIGILKARSESGLVTAPIHLVIEDDGVVDARKLFGNGSLAILAWFS